MDDMGFVDTEKNRVIWGPSYYDGAMMMWKNFVSPGGKKSSIGSKATSWVHETLDFRYLYEKIGFFWMNMGNSNVFQWCGKWETSSISPPREP